MRLRRVDAKLAIVRSLLCVGIVGSSSAAATWYVKPTASGAGDGSSWADAATLSAVLADQSLAAGDEVWVHSGTYTGPFDLKNGVRMIGGFDGAETQASQSTPHTNVTVLDGGGSTRAVTSTGHGTTTVLRGFYIRNGADSSYDGGGGMKIDGSSLLVVDCVFEDNTATWWGGAVVVRGNGTPTFVSCRFAGNGSTTSSDTYGGGAVMVYEGSPTFTNCLFFDNEAAEGGAIAIRAGSPTILSSTITGNEATVGTGGGVHDQEGTATIHNTILWDNVAVDAGTEQLFNYAGRSSTVTYCDFEGGFAGTGNINSDPLFQDPSSGNYRLQGTSPCIGAGLQSLLPTDVADIDWDSNTTELIPRDLGFAVRISSGLDIGAYERKTGGGGAGSQ